MGFFGDDDDTKYDKYLSDGSMWGKMDRDEWQRSQNLNWLIASAAIAGEGAE